MLGFTKNIDQHHKQQVEQADSLLEGLCDALIASPEQAKAICRKLIWSIQQGVYPQNCGDQGLFVTTLNLILNA